MCCILFFFIVECVCRSVTFPFVCLYDCLADACHSFVFVCCVFDVEMCAYDCDSLVLFMTKHWDTESVVEERHLHALTLEALVDEAKLTFHLKYHERHLHALTLEALVVTRDPVMKKTSNPKRTLNVRDSASERASNQENVLLFDVQEFPALTVDKSNLTLR